MKRSESGGAMRFYNEATCVVYLLSKMLQAAIFFSRMPRILYLCFDGLCIIQKDESDVD